MNADAYVEFLARCGMRSRRASAVHWIETGPRIWMSVPFQADLDPREVAADPPVGLVDLAARFPCPAGLGRPSYRLVCRDTGYGLSTLESKARNQTRRGLERCTVERVEPASLRGVAEELEAETRERQERSDGQPDLWKRFLSAAEAVPGAETWAAFNDGSVGAFVLAFRMDRWLHITHVRSRRAALASYPNNALLYEVNRRSLETGGCEAVSIGFESLQENVDGLDRFKLAMGYRREPVGCRIMLGGLGRALVMAMRLPGGRASIARIFGPEAHAKLVGMARWIREQDAA